MCGGAFAGAGTMTGSMDLPTKGGFDFDLCRRNNMLEKNGLKLPGFLKTGTTIVGLVFQVRPHPPTPPTLVVLPSGIFRQLVWLPSARSELAVSANLVSLPCFLLHMPIIQIGKKKTPPNYTNSEKTTLQGDENPHSFVVLVSIVGVLVQGKSYVYIFFFILMMQTYSTIDSLANPTYFNHVLHQL
jgi:hypothetical protein